jgi:hypothetical protein
MSELWPEDVSVSRLETSMLRTAEFPVRFRGDELVGITL